MPDQDLPESVSENMRRAIARADHWKRGDRTWEIIRAELLRLARENAECRRNERVAIERVQEQRARAEKAEADVADHLRAFKALSERYRALEARIAAAPRATVFTDAKIYCDVPKKWIGKPVRLVVDE